MKSGRLYVLLFLFQAAACLHASAQRNPQNLITGNFHDLNIEQFAEELESQTSYYFYYDISVFDSLKIN
ncbi:MAG: hypothetical protein ABIY90_10170, partial [Puia sp.]